MKTKYDEIDIIDMAPKDPKKKKFMPKRKPDNDNNSVDTSVDSSVDSKGNIKGLIDYSESEIDEAAITDIVPSTRKSRLIKSSVVQNKESTKSLIAKLQREKERLLKQLKVITRHYI